MWTVSGGLRSWRLGMTTCALALGACRSGELVAVVTPEPVPQRGSATVSMTGSPEGLSAIQLRIIGAGLSSPAAGDGARILSASAVGDTTLLVLAITGDVSAPLVTLTLADLTTVVTARVDAAAGGRAAGYPALKAADVVVEVAKK